MRRKDIVKKHKTGAKKEEKINIRTIVKILAIIIILIGIIFLIKFKGGTAKIRKIGNNSTSQEIVNYILNISSYDAIIDVGVNSNKNTNKYKIKQQYIEDGINMQEVIEPTNIAGVRIIKDGDALRIENTSLNLSTIFENYNYMSDNVLDLESFIQDFKDNADSKFEEKDDRIIMMTMDNSNEKNKKNKTLYIEKSTGKPIEMEIKDNNKKTTIYIKYNEVNVNSK